MNLCASSLELWRVRADAVFQSKFAYLPAILKGIVKIQLSNYGAGLAETVTTV
jgi:hypothetical protein